MHYFVDTPNFNLAGEALKDQFQKFNHDRPQKDGRRIKDWCRRIQAVMGMKNPSQDLIWQARRMAGNIVLEVWALDSERELANQCLDSLSMPELPKPKKVRWKFHNEHLWS